MARRKLTSSHPFYALLRAGMFIGALIVVAVIASSFLLSQLDAMQDKALANTAERYARVLADSTNPEQLEERLSLLAEASDIKLSLKRNDLIEVSSPSEASTSRRNRAVIRRDPQLTNVITAAIPVPGTKHLLVLKTNQSQDIILTQRTITAAFWIGSIICLTTLALVLWRARRNREDVRAIVNGASRFARGDLAFRILPCGETEWDRLAVSMNRMARQLADQLRSIQTQRMEQRAILQSMGSAVIALDGDHHLLSVNRAAESLFTLDASCRGKLLEEVLREPGLHRIVTQVLDTGSSETDEFESVVLPGRRLSAICERMFGADQIPIGAVVIVDDVTDIRRLEHMRSDFAANVSHELRTPITSIQGYVETLLETNTDDPDQSHRFLEIIRRNSERLAAIIEDLLTLASLERPGEIAESDQDITPVRMIISEVIDRMGQSARAKNIELQVECADEFTIRSRGDLIVEALSNLVSNAIRYTPENAPVLITVDSIDGFVRISVIDEGPGIPERHVPRLFERFYRVDKARSRSEGGTGLGLAIVKHIALAHGGRVEVETKLGAGSTFMLDLPAVSPQSHDPN